MTSWMSTGARYPEAVASAGPMTPATRAAESSRPMRCSSSRFSCVRSSDSAPHRSAPSAGGAAASPAGETASPAGSATSSAGGRAVSVAVSGRAPSVRGSAHAERSTVKKIGNAASRIVHLDGTQDSRVARLDATVRSGPESAAAGGRWSSVSAAPSRTGGRRRCAADGRRGCSRSPGFLPGTAAAAGTTSAGRRRRKERGGTDAPPVSPPAPVEVPTTSRPAGRAGARSPS